ncbi:palmitoyltransferase ZDHHC9 isoform X1 [Mobula hypostoma]|uniref:palmitoyltransferase ZDHHC9 isoform X1 n=1 Tax=Mobula hypostoma TaxID=723540 RepID=UPI002FC321CC
MHFDPSLPIPLACDASPHGIGAVLSHKFPDGLERPIAFASRRLTSAKRNYVRIDREALSLVWGVKKFSHYLFGQKFTLLTDHQLLVSIFNPRKGIPVMTAQRLQRWSFFVEGHMYDIEHKGTKQHGNADGLLHLPLPTSEITTQMDSAEVFHTTIVEQLPVTNSLIERETRNDPILSKVYDLTVKGWPARGNTLFPAFSARKEQLSVCWGTLMCGSRVVTKNYSGCQKIRNTPPQAPLHPWEWSSSPCNECTSTLLDHSWTLILLIAVNAHYKWPEVIKMKTTTSEKTITVLRTMFARNGIPEQICTDNGRQFVSEEFQSFVKNNGIKHFASAPYHPSTTGSAEGFVQTFKKAIKAMDSENRPLQHKIDNFLLAYHNAVHATTNQTPAMMFLNRNLRSRMDLLKPDVWRDVESRLEC